MRVCVGSRTGTTSGIQAGIHGGLGSGGCRQGSHSSLLCPFLFRPQVAYPRLQPALSDAVCSCLGCCHEPAPRRQRPPPVAEPGAEGQAGAASEFKFAAADSGLEAVAELEAAIAAADPGYTCLYDALQVRGGGAAWLYLLRKPSCYAA